MLGVLLGCACERNDDARIVYLARGTNYNARMLADKLRWIRIVWEINPKVLPDARCAGDQLLTPADPDPPGGPEFIIGRKGARWNARRIIGFGGHSDPSSIRAESWTIAPRARDALAHAANLCPIENAVTRLRCGDATR
jgi:hypothetical protein